MQPVIIAMTLAAAIAAHWINTDLAAFWLPDEDELECLIDPGTDYCVGCIDDCLAPADHEED